MNRVELLQAAMMKMAGGNYFTSEAMQNPVHRPAGQVVIRPPSAAPQAAPPKVRTGTFTLPGGGQVKVGYLVPASEITG